MMIEQKLVHEFCNAIIALYSQQIDNKAISINKTRKDIAGDFTINVFPFLKISRKSPEQTAVEIGEQLKKSIPELESFDVIKGFLNLTLTKTFWVNCLNDDVVSSFESDKKRNILIEFSSPNTNKPLHLGHIRNNLIGHSVSEILKANGHKVSKVNLVNDRGIHICKSMLAWQKWGNGETPENSGKKGDKLVGDYYVKFDKMLKLDIYNLFILIKHENLTNNSTSNSNKDIFTKAIAIGVYKYLTIKKSITLEEWNKLDRKKLLELLNKENIDISKNDNSILKKLIDFIEKNKEIDFNNASEKKIFKILVNSLKSIVPLYKEAQDMLQKWEAHDSETLELWNKMNGWVYEGFEKTYHNLGISFDKTYYESKTYQLGKAIVNEGLKKGILQKKEDQSIWADLTPDGLDEKLLLRSDGTSVYMTQDIGTAIMRKEEFNADEMIYVVGNEQIYHFQVLKLVLKKLEYEWYDKIFHLSYGMVELPEGKMKSREGTVVDADELIEEMCFTAKSISQELGKLEGLSETEIDKTIKMVGLGALKYFILKVDPKKNMVFNPAESIDFDGNTGPFIQYTHARIKSVLRKAAEAKIVIKDTFHEEIEISDEEKSLLKLIVDYQNIIHEAANELSPAIIANYIYALVKEYNQFYHNFSILKEENTLKRDFRLYLSFHTANRIKQSMNLLGIDVPERM